MKKLKRHINESFFNPLLFLIPLLFFLVLEDTKGIYIAFAVTVPLSIALLVYVYFFYNRVFRWMLYSVVSFLALSMGMSFFISFLPVCFHLVAYEYVCLMFFVVVLLFKNKITKRILNVKKTKMISMVNNLNEFYRVLWLYTIVFFVYIHSYMLAYAFLETNTKYVIQYIYFLFVGALLFIIIYEIIRVTIVRIRLKKEEWWPIVNEQGKVIGSVQHLESLNDKKKYMHPIIRVMFIDESCIFMQKRSEKDKIAPCMWDAAISNHVRMGETIEQCVKRTAYERYGLNELKPVFLSNYVQETEFEYHYAFLFVAGKKDRLEYNPEYIEMAKWWTVQQIDENISSGIFTENLVTEIELLRRSGLLEKGVCHCHLKEVVKQNKLRRKK